MKPPARRPPELDRRLLSAPQGPCSDPTCAQEPQGVLAKIIRQPKTGRKLLGLSQNAPLRARDDLTPTFRPANLWDFREERRDIS